MSDSEHSRSEERVSWGFREFLQVSGLTLAAGLLSMYVTQKTILKDLSTIEKTIDSVVSEARYRAKRDAEYLEYKVETYKERHDAECREIRRRIGILELRAGIVEPVIGDANDG